MSDTRDKMFAICNRVSQRIGQILTALVRFKNYVGAEGCRSLSDNGFYICSVEKSVRSYRAFSHFKRDPHYRSVLEHVTKEQGGAYLDIIKTRSPEMYEELEKYKINDLIGNPITHCYPGVGRVSPTTLRYTKVLSDLMHLFGNLDGGKVAEIGVGYGGQFLILDQFYNLFQYHCYDLNPVLRLVSKYLEAHIINSSYRMLTLNQSDGSAMYDLVISNYAFSELPKKLQGMYAKKILWKAKRGYMTMNSGKHTNSKTLDRMTLDELSSRLPPFEVLAETPLTSPQNYLIVWGHQ